jgi:hypothetical protein
MTGTQQCNLKIAQSNQSNSISLPLEFSILQVSKRRAARVSIGTHTPANLLSRRYKLTCFSRDKMKKLRVTMFGVINSFQRKWAVGVGVRVNSLHY